MVFIWVARSHWHSPRRISKIGRLNSQYVNASRNRIVYDDVTSNTGHRRRRGVTGQAGQRCVRSLVSFRVMVVLQINELDQRWPPPTRAPTPPGNPVTDPKTRRLTDSTRRGYCNSAPAFPHPTPFRAAASIFFQLYLYPAVHISFSRFLFQLFFSRPLPLRLCVIQSSACLAVCVPTEPALSSTLRHACGYFPGSRTSLPSSGDLSFPVGT